MFLAVLGSACSESVRTTTTLTQALQLTDNLTAALLNPLEVNYKTLNFLLACLQ